MSASGGQPRRQFSATADHPDQRWHTDLMCLFFAGHWFWLVDGLDAYSCYLLRGDVLLTAPAEGMQLAVQRALNTLADRTRSLGEPEIVHDRGPQFLGCGGDCLCIRPA